MSDILAELGVSHITKDGIFMLKKGEDIDIVLYVTFNGQPVDFSGYSAEMMIRETPESTPLISLSTANGGLTLGSDSQGSFIRISITNQQSSSLQPASALYEIDLIKDGKRKTLQLPSHKVICNPDITTAI